jgi:hypothetical protein
MKEHQRVKKIRDVIERHGSGKGRKILKTRHEGRSPRSEFFEEVKELSWKACGVEDIDQAVVIYEGRKFASIGGRIVGREIILKEDESKAKVEVCDE